MKIGIYNHQHYRGGCPGCSQTYVKGMINDASKCKVLARRLYGSDCEYINYTDLGDYPPDNLNRPGFKRMEEDIKNGNIDAIFTIKAEKISSKLDLILEFYKLCKVHQIDFVTVANGPDIMHTLDILLAKPKEEIS